MKRHFRIVTAAIFGLLATVSPVLAKDKVPAKNPAQEAMMAAWMKNSAPGDSHGILAAAAGKWTHTSKFWSPFSPDPEVTQGTDDMKMIFNGRYLQQDSKGTAMGQPFEGLGFTGYDNVRGEYQAIWMDNMSVEIMQCTGRYDAAAKVMTSTGTMSDPGTGKRDVPVRTVWRMPDNDNSVFEMYAPGPDGKEMKCMEIVYKRVK